MSGHSQFSNIKHRKEAQDKKRGKVFQKISKEIMVLAKHDNNPDTNHRLRLVIEQAKKQNMKKEAIQKALLSSQQNKEDYFEITYEAFGPAKTCFIVQTLTNNKNRTASNIRAIFSKNGGNIGSPHSLEFIFQKKAIFEIINENTEENYLLEKLSSTKITDIQTNHEKIIISAEAEDFFLIHNILKEENVFPISEEITWIPNEFLENIPENNKKSIETIIDQLEKDDDVQKIYYNFVI